MTPKMPLQLLVTCFLHVTVVSGIYTGFTPCKTPDCIQYRADFADCNEVTSRPSGDCRWTANINRRLDETILQGTIIAYKIQWFSRQWSNWFVPGQNDFDLKYNPKNTTCRIPVHADSLRRKWANFNDHSHKYIICK